MKSSKKKAHRLFLLIALLILIAVAFLVFMNQYKTRDSFTTLSKNSETITSEDLLRKCGDITRDDFGLQYTPAHVITGPEWSSDCKYAVMGIVYKQKPYETSETVVTDNLKSIDGIYLYDSGAKNVSKIYYPKSPEETPTFLRWINPTTILFSNGVNDFNYDTSTGNASPSN